MEQLQKIKDELVKQYNDLCERHDNLCEAYENIERSLIDNNSNRKKTLENIQKNVLTRIELEKLDNRIIVLSKVIDNLAVHISLSEQGIITLPNDLLESKESINQKLLTLLESEYKELDILSTKIFLSNEFKTERLKGFRKYQFGPKLVLSALISIYCVWLPYMYITPIPFSLTNLFLSLGIISTCGVTSTYYLTKKSTHKKIDSFINANKSLGDEALPIENDDTKEEQSELKTLIDEKIRRIMTILLKQKEYQSLINITSEGKDSQLGLDNNLAKNMINDKKTSLPHKFQHPVTIEEPNIKSNIDWVLPYLEEDIETDTVIHSEEQNRAGLKRTLTPSQNNDK